MKTNDDKRDEVIRLLRWAAAYPSIWTRIYSDDSQNPQECMEIIDELKKNGFYILIPVLLERSKTNFATDMALYKLVLNKLADDWERKDLSTIITELEDILQQQNHKPQT